MLEARRASEPLIFRVPWVGQPEAHKDCEIFDYETGLRIDSTGDAELRQTGEE